jgi:hypothetical protein
MLFKYNDFTIPTILESMEEAVAWYMYWCAVLHGMQANLFSSFGVGFKTLGK